MATRLYIPTLQEYAKKRKKDNLECSEILGCEDCEFCKNSLDACIWGENIRNISSLTSCPITRKCSI